MWQVEEDRNKEADKFRAFCFRGVADLRLAEMLAKATLEQTEGHIAQDLEAIKEYVAKVQDHGKRQAWLQLFRQVVANLCQGLLDMKYLNARYENGKKWVQKFMDGHHRHCLTSLPKAQADLLTVLREDAKTCQVQLGVKLGWEFL